MVEKKKGRRVIAPEVKAKVLAALAAGGKLSEVSKQFDVSVPTLSLWKKDSKTVVPVTASHGSDKRLELALLEIDYLKKRLAIYEK